ncbi:TPA: hypothetical protein ACQQJB_001828 [Pseudomonas aeruginosa]
MSAETPRERPILFNDQMVRAILEGRKTVTRRVVKYTGFYAIDAAIHGNDVALREREALSTRCPFGQPGDRLWVREAWQGPLISDEEQAANQSWWKDMTKFQDQAHCAYRASGDNNEYVDPDGYFHCKWKPSIHMPRWASRILLEITAVRVERLQDISEEQARAEGYPAERECETGGSGLDAWLWFRSLWGEINGPEAFTANPWVWVIEFKRVTP